MPNCAYCNTVILFGGVRQGNRRYCNRECERQGMYVLVSREIPQEEVDATAEQVFHGDCPICNGSGPVELHTSYRNWSAWAISQFESRPRVSCQPCAVRRKLTDSGYSLLLGWWSPVGLVMTPVQVCRNLYGILRPVRRESPSPELKQAVSLQIAAYIVHNTPRGDSSLEEAEIVEPIEE